MEVFALEQEAEWAGQVVRVSEREVPPPRPWRGCADTGALRTSRTPRLGLSTAPVPVARQPPVGARPLSGQDPCVPLLAALRPRCELAAGSRRLLSWPVVVFPALGVQLSPSPLLPQTSAQVRHILVRSSVGNSTAMTSTHDVETCESTSFRCRIDVVSETALFITG